MGARPIKIYSFLILLSAVVGFSLPQAVSAAENLDKNSKAAVENLLKKYVTDVGLKHSNAGDFIDELVENLGDEAASS